MPCKGDVCRLGDCLYNHPLPRSLWILLHECTPGSLHHNAIAYARHTARRSPHPRLWPSTRRGLRRFPVIFRGWKTYGLFRLTCSARKRAHCRFWGEVKNTTRTSPHSCFGVQHRQERRAVSTVRFCMADVGGAWSSHGRQRAVACSKLIASAILRTRSDARGVRRPGSGSENPIGQGVQVQLKGGASEGRHTSWAPREHTQHAGRLWTESAVTIIHGRVKGRFRSWAR